MKPYYQHAGITIYHGDCREILPTLDFVADVLITEIKATQTSKEKEGKTCSYACSVIARCGLRRTDLSSSKWHG